MTTAEDKVRMALALPETKRRYNRRLFEIVAPRYGLVTRLLSFGRDGAWKRHLVAQIPRRRVQCCVDLACGSGDVSLLLAERFREAEIWGVDLTPSMLALARRRIGRKRVHFIEGDMCHTTFADNSVDVVTGGYALRNAPDLESALDEIFRILAPGGDALFLDFSKPAEQRQAARQYRLLRFWGRLWGLLLHGDPSVYGYIATSLSCFPDRGTLGRLVESAGFTWCSETLFMGGMLSCSHFRKPERASGKE